MKTITVYEVIGNDKVKLSTTSLEEAKDFKDMIFDYDGTACYIQEYEYTPVDHSKQS